MASVDQKPGTRKDIIPEPGINKLLSAIGLVSTREETPQSQASYFADETTGMVQEMFASFQTPEDETYFTAENGCHIDEPEF